MGGAISDLASRVSNLENKKIPYPDYTKAGSTIYTTTAASWPMFPNFSPDKANVTDPIIIPRDGWLRVYMSIRNTENKACELRVYINNQCIVFGVCQADNDFMNDCVVPVSAGDKITFRIELTEQRREQPTSGYITIQLIPFS